VVYAKLESGQATTLEERAGLVNIDVDLKTEKIRN